jgi:endogenous inhibitor of DNA gyrase (YacG/DUF329 family)
MPSYGVLRPKRDFQYVNCPECRRRMRRSGEKTLVKDNAYLRTYKCPACGHEARFDESRNSFR